MRLKPRDIFIYCMALFFALLIISIYWTMFFYRTTNLTLVANDIGEFWVEFYGLNILLIIIIYFFIGGIKDFLKDIRNLKKI